MRLFVAAMPDGATVNCLRETCGGWPRPKVAGLRWTGPDQWHVTLRFLGSVDPGEAAAALDGLGWAAAEARLGPVTALLGRAVLMVPVGGVDGLAGAVAAATVDLGGLPEAVDGRSVGQGSNEQAQPPSPTGQAPAGPADGVAGGSGP